MSIKRIAKIKIDLVLKKILKDELRNVEKIIGQAECDVLTITGEGYRVASSYIHKDLIIDFLIDYTNALEIEIKELEEK